MPEILPLIIHVEVMKRFLRWTFGTFASQSSQPQSFNVIWLKKFTDWCDGLDFSFCCNKGNSLQAPSAITPHTVTSCEIFTILKVVKNKRKKVSDSKELNINIWVKKHQPSRMPWQGLGNTLSTIPQYILSMFIHGEQAATLSQRFRDGSVWVCMYVCVQNGKCIGSHVDTKIFMKSQVIQKMCSAEGISRTYICTCTNRKETQSHIQNYIHQIPQGFSRRVYIRTDLGRQMCKMLGAFSWVEQ